MEYIFGIRTIIEAIRAGKNVDKVLIKNGLQGSLYAELMELLKNCKIPFRFVPLEKIDSITKKNHQGVVAYISLVEYVDIEQLVPQIFDSGKVPFLVAADGITDVRNIGAMLRSCECAGVDSFIFADKNSAQINADMVKTSAGAIHHLPLYRSKNLSRTLQYLKNCGLQIVAATEKATDSHYSVDFSLPTLIIIGAEDKGISVETLRWVDKKVKIPIFGKISSLNVSTATAVMVYEVVRQRNIPAK